MEQTNFPPNTSGVVKVTTHCIAVSMEQLLYSTAMKETILSSVDTEETTKPSMVVKVMIKSMFKNSITTLTQKPAR